jgi:RNA polymerase sigma-70 factor (ECF subfamily)
VPAPASNQLDGVPRDSQTARPARGRWPADSSDGDLVERARRGDRPAFGLLVSKYQDRVYNLCFRLCRSESDAADLAQAAFLKALQALPRFESRSGFFTWLYRIAVNLALSHRRARLARDAAWEPERDPRRRAASDDQDDPAARCAAREEHERLGRALERLDSDFRAAVVLKDVEGLDYAAIAEILDVPVGTVKSRIHRGRLVLREHLQAPQEKHGAIEA